MFLHKSILLVVGSRLPYHHPIVGTSANIVLAATEAGGEPRGYAAWCVGMGWLGVERDNEPGMRLEGYTSHKS
jgi:hypothetical protein